MKKIFFIFTTIFLTTIFLFSLQEYSFAQLSSLDDSSETFIFVQTFVHNSQGQLINYLSSNKFSFIHFQPLTNLLNTEENENDPIVTINGKNFQVITRLITIPYEKINVIASTIIAHSTNGTLNMVARFAHDGYPLVDGDKVTTIWTFIRPAK